MEDARLPPESDDDKGDRARRSSVKLRDAEAVATTRRDIFGDGSLLDSLASPPTSSDQGQGVATPPPPAAETADAAQRDAGEGKPPLGPLQGDQTSKGLSPDLAQSLDAIIDSFPSEPPSDPSEPIPDPPQRLDLQRLSGADFLRPPPHFAPLDGGFGARSLLARQLSVTDLEPPSLPGPPDGGESGMEEGHAGASAPAPGTRGPDNPDGDLPPAANQEGQDGHKEEHAPDAAELTEAGAPGSAASGTEPPAKPAAHPLDFGSPPFPHAPGVEPFPEPASWTDAGAPAQPLSRGMPPFIELPANADAPLYPEPSGLPPFPEPPIGAAPPPYPEESEVPPFPEPPAADPRYPEPVEVPRFAVARDVPMFHQVDAPSPRPAFDTAARAEATAKIAAEATATAEALENLKRLLMQSAPEPEPAEPAHGSIYPNLDLEPDPAPYMPNAPAPLLPLPVPPPPGPGRSVYLLGFLTGLALALAAGAALYFLINAG